MEPWSFRPALSIAQHLPAPQLSPLQQQIQHLMTTQGGPSDLASVVHVTETLISTVNGMSTLKRALGAHVVGSLMALLLKEDTSRQQWSPNEWQETNNASDWLFEQPPPRGSPVLSSSQVNDFLPVGLLE